MKKVPQLIQELKLYLANDKDATYDTLDLIEDAAGITGDLDTDMDNQDLLEQGIIYLANRYQWFKDDAEQNREDLYWRKWLQKRTTTASGVKPSQKPTEKEVDAMVKTDTEYRTATRLAQQYSSIAKMLGRLERHASHRKDLLVQRSVNRRKEMELI